jgi:hypothetical protein
MNPSRAELCYGARYEIIKRQKEKEQSKQHHTRERDPGQKPRAIPPKNQQIFFFIIFFDLPSKRTWHGKGRMTRLVRI